MPAGPGRGDDPNALGGGSKALAPVNGPWTEGGGSLNTHGMLFSGLPRGKDVWVRLRALGTKGYGPWSDPATIMVT